MLIGHHTRAPLPVVHVGCLLVALAAVGLVFGATQTGVAARMVSAPQGWAGGLVLTAGLVSLLAASPATPTRSSAAAAEAG